MDISQARTYQNRTVDLTWNDRTGAAQTKSAHVFEVAFIPLYGPCLVTTEGDIRLDRVVDCRLRLAEASLHPVLAGTATIPPELAFCQSPCHDVRGD